ncbi:MAG: hypothetical protein FJ291_02295 [Planctomycetes bacterium]|nr:hypothetical protein [Planctomycetota bacterium]
MGLSVLHAPILSKELIEQAARPRTYVVRVAFAALLFVVFIASAYSVTRRLEAGEAVTGSGRGLFQMLVLTLFAGIVLCLPATMSAAITEEKERRTLELLLLTRLRPRHILWEKYAGRLVPVLMFLILSLPLLAVCYAFGGLTADDLLIAAYVLFLTCLQVGALALMCSAWCRTSLSAFFTSYALLVVIYLLGWPLTSSGGWVDQTMLPLCPYVLLDARDFASAFETSHLMLLSVVFFLVMARVFLVRRAFVAPRRLLVAFFRRLDGFLERHGLALRFRRRRRHLRHWEDLPDRKPIGWREVARKPLVKPAHLVYILLLLEGPVLLFLLVLSLSEKSSEPGVAFIAPRGALWEVGTAAVVGMSVNAISAERSAQTLEVLLTTPIAGRDIVRQKLHGVRRVIAVFFVPFGTLFLAQLLRVQEGYASWRSSPAAVRLSFVGLSFLSVGLFLWQFAWLTMWMGLRTRSRSRAVVSSVVALLVWSAAPLLGVAQAWSGNLHRPSLWDVFAPLTSPVGCIAVCEVFPNPYWAEMSDALGFLFVAVFLHAGVLFVFRFLCLRRADAYLGRARPRRRFTSGGFFYAPPEQ